MTFLRLANSAGRFRRVLFKTSVIGALILIPFILFDLFVRRVFSDWLARLDWPLPIYFCLVWAFLFSDLVGELRGMLLSERQGWADDRHFGFVVSFYVILLLTIPLLYFIAVHAMVEQTVGSPG